VAILTAVIGAIIVMESPLTSIQLLWVNLIMDSFASLALATELPTPQLLERKPYGRTRPLVNRSMFRFIIGHGFYQLIIMLLLTFHGHKMFDVEYGFNRGHGAPPTTHLTILFNTFVLMQVFNEINARMVHGERNVFKGIFTNKLFIIIGIGTLLVQIVLVECTGRAFMVKPLTLTQWLWCFFFGFTELLWGQVVLCIPKFSIPKAFSFGKGSYSIGEDKSAMGKVLWVRSLSRLQYQIRVVNAFRNNLDSHNRTMNIASPAVFNSLVVPLTGVATMSSQECNHDGQC
jgi:magnesium-transporting ATPase (P-type)